MKSKHFFRMTLALFLILAAACEKNKTFENSDYNAEITGFTADKCFCCWGWEIKIGDLTIKTDSLPDVSLIGYSISTPIPVEIVTGRKKISCGGNPDYYEIKSLKLAR